MELKKEINAIDFCKFVLAFFVVAIHTDLLELVSEPINWGIMHLMFRLAVPFFYVVSGYFLGRKLFGVKDKKTIFKSYRKKQCIPLIVWGGLALITYGISLCRNGTSMIGVIARVVRSAVFYPRGAMWFVAACIISSFILEFVLKRKIRRRYITIVALVLYGVALIANTYYFVIEGTIFQTIIDIYMKVCISARNGVFLFIYMWLGYLLADESLTVQLDRHKELVNVILVGSILTFVLEVVYTYNKNAMDDSSLFASFVVLIPMLVYKLLNYHMKANLPYKDMRKISTYVYYLHPQINTLFSGWFDFNGAIQFITVSLMCCIIYIVVNIGNLTFLKRILE